MKVKKYSLGPSEKPYSNLDNFQINHNYLDEVLV